MSHLGMTTSVKNLMIDDGAATYTGAYRDVHERVQPAPGAPTGFRQSRAVHIGVEANWHPQCLTQRTRKVAITPTHFRCVGYISILWGVKIRVDGPKAAHSH